MRRDGHVPLLQPLYDGPYVIHRSLHHFTLRIGDKEEKVSTLRLKPCTDPTALPAQPRVWGHRPPPSASRIFPHSSQQNRARNRFPLERCQGFLHAPPPFSTTPLLGQPATAKHRPDKTSRPAQPRVRGHPPASRFSPIRGCGDPPGTFTPQQSAEPRQELFSPGTLKGVFARPAAILDHAAAWPASNR